MKLKLFYLLIALVGGFTFVSCDDDDDAPKLKDIPQACLDSFKAKFPEAKNVDWERKGTYYVAEYDKFNNREVEVSAWFAPDGTWNMTDTDYGKDLFMLPTEINTAFNQSEYSSWTIDDIDLYEYPDTTKDFYLIEVEKAGQTDMELYFKTDGTLIKAIPDTNTDITPDTQI